MVATYTYKGLMYERAPPDVEEVEFADDVTVIRAGAFSECIKLKKVVIPNTVTEIEQIAFACCYMLKSVVINGSVKTIGFNTFTHCFNLEQLILLNGVEEIHEYAFSCCTSLRSVFIPESVTMIAIGVFASFDSLEYVVLMTSKNQQNIHKNAFVKCRSLKCVFKVSKESTEQKLPVIAKYPVGFETMKRLLDIDCQGVECTNAERLYPFMAQASISNLDKKYDADHLSSIYYLLRRDPSLCQRY